MRFSFRMQCPVAADGLHDTDGPDDAECYICGEVGEPTGLSAVAGCEGTKEHRYGTTATPGRCPHCGRPADQEVRGPEWKWENHPEVVLSDACANGACGRCGLRSCGHPCHPSAIEENAEPGDRTDGPSAAAVAEKDGA